MNYVKITIISIVLILICSCTNKSIEQTEGFKINFQDLTSGSINERYLFLQYNNDNIYNSSLPFYYDTASEKNNCRKFGETAKEVNIYAPPNHVGGPSRFAYYCEKENIYWIKDFPGNDFPSLYGPFEGYPK